MYGEVLVGFLILGLVLASLGLGVAAFFLALGLRKTVRRLEQQMREARKAPRTATPAISAEPDVLAAPPAFASASLPPAPPSSPAASPVSPPASPASPPASASPSHPPTRPISPAAPRQPEEAAARAAARPAAARSAPARPASRPFVPLPTVAARLAAKGAPAPRTTFGDIDRVLGTRVLNWVGAVVTLVGLAFLLKFLYDRKLVGPAGRVAIGMGFGLASLLFGELKLRKTSDLLAQAVSAVGIGAMFLTTYLSYKFYDFSGQVATFGFLAYFAAFTVALAVLRRARILVGIGFLCAYATPYLLSTGQDQAEILFGYLGLIAIACAVARVLRGWWGLTPLCLLASWVYYVGWYDRFYAPDRLQIAVIGAAGLTVLMTITAAARSLSRRVPLDVPDLISIIAAQLVGGAALWRTLQGDWRAELGIAMAALSLFDQGLLRMLRRRGASSDVASNTLILLATGALVLVIPAVLKAEGAVLAWAAAGCLLCDMGLRSRRLSLEVAAGVCLLAALAAGLEERVVHTGIFRAVANSIYLTWLGVVAAWLYAGLRWLKAKEGAPWRAPCGSVALLVAAILLLGLSSYEVIAWHAGQGLVPGADLTALLDRQTATLLLLWGAFPWIWLWAARKAPVLWIVSGAFYLPLGLAYLSLLRRLHRHDALILLNPAFLCGLVLPLGMLGVVRGLRGRGRWLGPTLCLYAHALIVLLLTSEILQTLRLDDWGARRARWVRIALVSVAWGLYATSMFWVGVVRGKAAFRWFALVLLLLTLVKVVTFDMAEVEQIWRVLSFMALGALLMGCSYLYVRHEKRMAERVKDGGVP